MRKERKIGFILLAVLYVFLGTIIFVNLANIPFGVVNPADPNFFQRYPIFYPPYNGAIGTANQVIIEVNITANGRLVDGKTATVSAVGSASSPFSSNITSVFITYVGAEPALNTSYATGLVLYGPNFGKIVLVPSTNCPTHPSGIILDTILCGSSTQIIWPNAGAYYPLLSIRLNNGKTLNETITDYLTPVLSSSNLQTEQTNRINTAFSIALVSFGFMEGVNIVRELTEGKNGQSSSILPKRNR
jgi:hypothetical protein